jgi:hypothetical protein
LSSPAAHADAGGCTVGALAPLLIGRDNEAAGLTVAIKADDDAEILTE